jgi:uncharacterized phage protein (predicted DNA packaging)
MNIIELDTATAKNYLRVEHNDDDELLSMLLSAAKSYIQSYLNQKFVDMQISPEGLPEELTIPALALTAHWYENRQITTEVKSNEVLHTFKEILSMHRYY